MKIHRHLPFLTRSLIGCCCALSAASAHAQADPASPWNVSGFGSVGVTTSRSDFGGYLRHDLSQNLPSSSTSARPNTRLGVQVNHRFSSQWEAVVQAVAKDRSLTNGPQDALEWAFVSYRPAPDWLIRAGRTASDAYLLSDFRNVGFAYTPVRPPVEYYGQVPLQGFDGVDVTKTWNTQDTAQWKLKAALGKSSQRYQAPGLPAVLGRLKNLAVVNVSREDDGLVLRATVAKGQLSFDTASMNDLQNALEGIKQLPVASVAQEAAQFQVGLTSDFPIQYRAFGASYDRDQWLLTAEYMQVRTSPSSGSFDAGYVMAGRRIKAFTLYGSYALSRPTSPAYAAPDWYTPLLPVLGAAGAAQAQQLGSASAVVANFGRVQQHTTSLGVRWDVHPQVALKAQWDRTRVRPDGHALTGGLVTGGSMNSGTLVMDFIY